jgi:membrane protease YdiL (CAAX protease family)
MTKIKALLNRYAVFTYFFLTFLITWGSIFLLVGSFRFPFTRAQIDAAGPMVYVGMLLGPSTAGLLMIGLVEGRAGYRSLFSRLGKWRVGVRWYAIALLTVPVLVTAILTMLSRMDPAYQLAIAAEQDKATLTVTGVVMGLAVGFFEELGWTGFVVPRLRRRFGLLATGLVVGLLWGAWHYPPFSPSGSDAGAISPAVYLSILLFSFLPAYRVLLVWIYDRTHSLLLVVLMHAPLSACQLVLIPPALTGAKLVTYDLIFGAALWVIAAAVLVASPKALPAIKAEEAAV